jgi:hypothetical protein
LNKKLLTSEEKKKAGGKNQEQTTLKLKAADGSQFDSNRGSIGKPNEFSFMVGTNN